MRRLTAATRSICIARDFRRSHNEPIRITSLITWCIPRTWTIQTTINISLLSTVVGLRLHSHALLSILSRRSCSTRDPPLRNCIQPIIRRKKETTRASVRATASHVIRASAICRARVSPKWTCALIVLRQTFSCSRPARCTVVYMSRLIFGDRRDANPRVAVTARRKKSLEVSDNIMGCSRTRPIAESAASLSSDQVGTFAQLVFFFPTTATRICVTP